MILGAWELTEGNEGHWKRGTGMGREDVLKGEMNYFTHDMCNSCAYQTCGKFMDGY